MSKIATDVDVGEDAIARCVAQRRGKIVERRRRQGATARSLSAEFRALRWKEVGGILVCHDLQQDIDKYVKREDEAREKVEDFIDTYGGLDLVSEEEMLAVAEFHPQAKVEKMWGRVAKKAIRALAWHIRILLTYTQLRLELHVDLAQGCRSGLRSGHASTEEQRAILSAFSSKDEYRVQKQRLPGVEGEVVTGRFVLLDQSYNEIARVREAIARVTSLCPEDEEEDNEEADEED
ncbi:hypothetical protein EKO04_006977 [Ascochyta lentis]|uniref:Uncharacterized protein n=1 Tax=Ascochyta lentis TaxID=205686 RepID=A0A8H7IZB4_9PLEO|nr:hypothetical protein EKO04_006977 [Ascochyta lentis]